MLCTALLLGAAAPARAQAPNSAPSTSSLDTASLEKPGEPAPADSASLENPDEPTPAGDASIDPAGTYQFSFTYQGRRKSGQIRIRKAGSAYTGEIESNAARDSLVPIRGVVAHGNRLVVTGGDAGRLRFDLEMEGASFTGTWAAGPTDFGVLTGRKLESP